MTMGPDMLTAEALEQDDPDIAQTYGLRRVFQQFRHRKLAVAAWWWPSVSFWPSSVLT
jgi:hypothetical protein